MNMSFLKPSILALALVLPAAASQAGDCTADSKPQAATAGSYVYYNPWADLMRIQAAMAREFDALNEPLWMPVMFAPVAAFTMPALQSAALQQTPEGYQVSLKLPGYKAEDIHVRLDGRLLTVMADKSDTGTIKVGQQSEQSQSRSRYVETMTLPGPVEASALKENFKDGVLTISVPTRKTAAGSA